MANRHCLNWKQLVVPLMLGAAVLCSLPAAAATTYSTELSNGMKVIVQEDHRSPVVVCQVWYKVGSIDEYNGTSGVAHVLEHMMFKGTPTVPAGEFSKIVAAAGGRDNAFTNLDHTTYFTQLHKSQLELALRLEADRMRNLTFSEKEFAQEIKVVMEERRLRTEDKAHALLHERLMATVFIAHPYQRPVIGWMNDLENMKLADAKAWYDRWYAPNNATLVVVGDVEPKAVVALAQSHFGPLKPQVFPDRKPQVEPPQTGVKRIVVKAPAQLGYLTMAYRAPTLRNLREDWEPYALEVLSAVLDGNESARLPKALVRQNRIASSVDASYNALQRGPSVFMLDGTPSEGKSAAELEAAIREEVEKLKSEGVTEDELQRVKAQVLASEVFQRDSMFYQAMQIGNLETTGFSHKDLNTMLERIKAVTPQQVQDVARKYLQDDALTVAVLDPQPLAPKAPAPAVEGLRHAK